jgi:REP element-mobilizing transposase RayT
MRKIKFETGKYYHIFNRGVDKRKIFLEKRDYFRFLESMKELNTTKVIDSLYRHKQLKRKKEKIEAKLLRFDTNRRSLASTIPAAPLVEIIAYCLNPNHYHLLIKSLIKNGVSKFMHKLNTGYTKYFNAKHKRSGSLFQGTFKAVEITSDFQLAHASAYINGNAEVHKIAKAKDWPWSSYPDYLDQRENNLITINKQPVLVDFKNPSAYEQYVVQVIKNSAKIKQDIKKYLLE